MKTWYEVYGFSCGEIGTRLDRNESTVRQTLLRLGVKMRPRGGTPGKPHNLTPAELQRFRHMYVDEQLSLNEIAEREDLQQNSVRWRLTCAGVKLRSREEAIRLRFARRGRNQTPAATAAALRNLEKAREAHRNA